MDYATLATYENPDYSDVNRYSDITQKTVTASTQKEDAVVIQNKFGTLQFEADQFITFAQGLIGLTDFTRFGLSSMPNAATANNFRILQSLEEKNLSFIVFPTTAKTALLEAGDVASLCNTFSIAEDDLLLLHIVTVREMFGKVQMTLNVKAPIVIDASKRTAQQYVLPSNKYDIQVPLAA